MMNYNPFSLEGKTVLVTGASSGIGRSIAIECSKMGARVVVTARSESRLNETLALMAGEGHQAICVDLGDEDSIVNLVEQLPQLNGVVHNAGMAHRAPCKMVKKDQLEQVMTINFEGPVLLQKYLLKNLSPGLCSCGMRLWTSPIHLAPDFFAIRATVPIAGAMKGIQKAKIILSAFILRSLNPVLIQFKGLQELSILDI